jgi:hypothetical protein
MARRTVALTEPRGQWLIAGTPLAEAYPCMCRGSRACTKRCRCRGRVDTETLPAECCARGTRDE